MNLPPAPIKKRFFTNKWIAFARNRRRTKAEIEKSISEIRFEKDIDLNELAEETEVVIQDALNEIGMIYLGRSVRILSQDLSVYTGLAGIPLLYHDLALMMPSPESADEYMRAASQILARFVGDGTRRLGKERASFLQGSVGMASIALVVFAKQKILTREMEKRLLEHIKEAGQEVLLRVTHNLIYNELLYGRAGYLWALLWLRSKQKKLPVQPDKDWISVEHIKEVVEIILEEGSRGSRTHRAHSKFNGKPPPLFYEWHAKCYLGAAHGFCGILYVLLCAREFLPRRQQDVDELIFPTMKRILNETFTSGNLAASLHSKTDALVQWCHGAAGTVHLLIEADAADTTGKRGFLKQAEEFGRVVWRRGLLVKGNSLCHGVAGNGFVFLALYQATGRPIWLKRAEKFARFILDRPLETVEESPERPYSLFEGKAGVIHFLASIQEPSKASFPGYQLNPILPKVISANTNNTINTENRSYNQSKDASIKRSVQQQKMGTKSI